MNKYEEMWLMLKERLWRQHHNPKQHRGVYSPAVIELMDTIESNVKFGIQLESEVENAQKSNRSIG